jgi:hypothetical protein
MASLLLGLLLLRAPAVIPGTQAAPAPLILSIDLDAEALLADPSPLAADTLVLLVEAGREAGYRMEEQGEVLAAGKLLPGRNTLRFTRPGLSSRSQELAIRLELLEAGEITRKTIRVIMTVAPGADAAAAEKTELSGSFTLAMYHSGRLFGFRKKNMVELLKLKTGPVMPVPDPALSGAAGRSPSAGNSVSLIGLGMALAKYLAKKKADKMLRARAAEIRNKRLSMTLRRGQREFPIIVELRVE